MSPKDSDGHKDFHVQSDDPKQVKKMLLHVFWLTLEMWALQHTSPKDSEGHGDVHVRSEDPQQMKKPCGRGMAACVHVLGVHAKTDKHKVGQLINTCAVENRESRGAATGLFCEEPKHGNLTGIFELRKF
jgi:hypothetical protein